MKRSALTIALIVAPIIAHSAVNVEVFCFRSSDNNNIHLEFRTYIDPEIKWEGAIAKYKATGEPLSLVLSDRQSESIDKNTPGRITRRWLEVDRKKFTGEYEMISQGVNVESMTYLSYRTRKEYHFLRDASVDFTEKGCEW